MRRGVWLIILSLLVAGGLVAARIFSKPDEEQMLANFRRNKNAFLQLRNILIEDSSLERLADWGVELSGSIGKIDPPSPQFSEVRYQQYLKLLEEAHGVAVYRLRSPDPSLCVLIWASGWAGDAQHASICWAEVAAASANTHKSTDPASRRHLAVIKPIEENWYLTRDYQ